MGRRSWGAGLASILVLAAGGVAPASAAGSATVPLTEGANDSGQLGRTAASPSLTIAPITGPAMAQVASGRDHVYGLDADGYVWAWGDNSLNQLGNGTTTDSATPLRLSLTGVTAIASGHYHGMAIRQDGSLWTWGYGTLGQLGLGTTGNRSTPAQVTTLADVTEVSAGRDMSYAVAAGSVYGWGANTNGEVGDGTTTQRLRPVAVVGLPEIRELAAGRNHSLAIDTTGRLWAWGDNIFGQLGDGTTTDRPTPRVVLTGVSHVAAGAHHSIAVLEDGRVMTWGRGYRGQLGLGSTASRTSPTVVPGVTGVAMVGAGRDTSYAVASDGHVWAWGDNATGQVGDGTTTTRTSPVLLARTGIAHAEGGSGHLVLLPAAQQPANQPPVAAFAQPQCVDLTCTVVSGSSDPDGTVVATSWDFGDGATSSQPTATHAYAAPGSYRITLLVTDDQGATATAGRTVQVGQVASPLGFRAATATTSNAVTSAVTVPAPARAGDALLLFVTTNTSTAVATPPTGWTTVGTQTAGSPDLRTTLYRRTATAGDPGARVQVGLAAQAKCDLTLLAYSGADATDPLLVWAAKSETSSRSSHQAPALTIPAAGSWVVSFWADKSSTTTGWTDPAGAVRRSSLVGSGSGRITSLAVDSGAAVPTGAWTGATATASAAGSKVTMFSVALRPAP